MKKYDYIIAGAGASGLSLVYYILNEKKLQHKNILIIDNHLKDSNDKTWCFWQKEESPFESCITNSWDLLNFYSPDFSDTLNIAPYRYKMIESKNFYDFCFKKINEFPNVEFINQKILKINDDGTLETNDQIFAAEYIFNSAFRNIPQEKNKHYLLQHFKGYFIETAQNIFNPDKATLMDFRIDQKEQCRFVYVLPTTKKNALVEFTIFSPQLLTDEEYDIELKKYIADFLEIAEYKIERTEFGVIPMTNANIKKSQSEKVINIGTAGGVTKASTGYTFSFIQKQCAKIAKSLAHNQSAHISIKNDKFNIYDTIFLRVLNENKYESRKIFSSMFKNLSPQTCLKFLDEESNLLEDIMVMNSVKKIEFIKSAGKEIANYII